MSDNKNTKTPEVVSLEEGDQYQKLSKLLSKKAKEKANLDKMEALHILKKSKFYYNSDRQMREHIANYKGYAIMIKQENIQEDIKDNNAEVRMFPSLVTLSDLKGMKKINGNIIRKLQPQSIHEFQKIALIQGVILEIDSGL